MIVWCTQCKTEPFDYPGLAHGHVYICEGCFRGIDIRPSRPTSSYYSLSTLFDELEKVWAQDPRVWYATKVEYNTVDLAELQEERDRLWAKHGLYGYWSLT